METKLSKRNVRLELFVAPTKELESQYFTENGEVLDRVFWSINSSELSDEERKFIERYIRLIGSKIDSVVYLPLKEFYVHTPQTRFSTRFVKEPIVKKAEIKHREAFVDTLDFDPLLYIQKAVGKALLLQEEVDEWNRESEQALQEYLDNQ